MFGKKAETEVVEEVEHELKFKEWFNLKGIRAEIKNIHWLTKKELFNNSKINKQVKEIFYKSYFFYYGVYNVGYAVYLVLSHRPFGKIEQNICSIILFFFISIDIYSKLKKYVVNSRKLIIFIIIIFVINSIFPIIGLIK